MFKILRKNDFNLNFHRKPSYQSGHIFTCERPQNFKATEPAFYPNEKISQ